MAVKYKAARLLLLQRTPMGVASEWEMPQRIGKDWSIKEMLYGLRFQDLVDANDDPIDFTTLVPNDELLEVLGEPEVNTWTGTDLSEARDAAVAWVTVYLSGPGVSTGASV